MAQFNQFQLLSGHFYYAEYIEYDEATRRWDKYPNVKFRYKPNDISSQGVSSGGKTTREAQNIQGSVYGKREFAISTTADLPFKKKDKIKIINEDKELRKALNPFRENLKKFEMLFLITKQVFEKRYVVMSS